MIGMWVHSILSAGGLSPYERFEAMRKLDAPPQSDLYALLTNKWFVLLGWSVIFVLLLILTAIRQHHKEKHKQRQICLFEDKANLFGLTPTEREILYSIARLARLRNIANIYFRPRDFETGMTRFLRKTLASAMDEDSKKQQLEAVEALKYKIGFVRKNISYKGRYRRGNHLTSRQIPVDEAVSVVPNSLPSEQEYKATVISNEVTGLGLRGFEPFPFQAGDACTIRYRIGAVLWGFDVLVVHCEGTELKVCHVDHARYINRRRFVRVPIHQPIWVAPFPVFCEHAKPGVPAFTKVEIVDFSGTTLRIRGSLDVQRRDRVLVMFEVEPGRVVQDIADVQRIGESETGPFYILELTGLDDRSENELIRITNEKAIEQGLDVEVQEVLDGEEVEMTMEVSEA